MFHDLTDFFKQAGVYMLGKGLLTVSVFAAAAAGAATGGGLIIPAIVAIGGFGLTVARRLHSQSLYQDNMVDLYRDNIADQLGIVPEQVGREHLKIAAKGNDIIAQALNRQHKKTILAIGTAALASAVSMSLIVGFGLGDTLKDLANQKFSDALKPLANFMGIGVIASISNLVLHEGLDAAIGHKAGIHKAAAHDLIYTMNQQVSHGKAISREQVFGVIVAGDASLHARITYHYNRPYEDMTQGEKSRVLHDLHIAPTMDKLAIAISDGKIRAGYLAYAAQDPALLAPRRATYAEQATTREKPARASFIERLGFTPNAELSHAERLGTAPIAELSASR